MIHFRGAPTKLISDHAQLEISNKVKQILRHLFIDGWQSEAYHQHQNFAEYTYQDVKHIANRLLDHTDTPPSLWLMALKYTAYLLNHTASQALDGQVPLQVLTGQTQDISALLCFCWYEPVYYCHDETSFPSETAEGRGRFVGFAENVGHALTFSILTDDTNKIIHCSEVQTAEDGKHTNLQTNNWGDDAEAERIIRSKNEESDAPFQKLEIVDIEELIGSTFAMPDEQGNLQDTVVMDTIRENPEDNSEHVKFKVSRKKDDYEDILSYDQLMDYIEQKGESPVFWELRHIVSHSGPLSQSHPSYKGSPYNVKVEWENGEITEEPLSIIAKDAPVACAIYAKKRCLLDQPGWKRFKRLAKIQRRMFSEANKAKIHSQYWKPKFKYGIQIPRDYRQALELDKQNGNTLWQDATKLEMELMGVYEVFKDVGKGTPVPDGYKNIRVHLIYDVKHDGRHRARLVADGHLTDVPEESNYSGVVSLRGFRLLVFLAELNGLKLWGTDISSAYLEAHTKEKVCIIAGPEFGPLEGHRLIVNKALYGLRTSGQRWHDRFAECMRSEGFFPSKVEPDIWLRENGDVYDYVAVYVDDLAFAMKDPGSLAETLQKKHKFKLKGTGELTFHLGADFRRDDDGTLVMTPTKYITERLVSWYEKIFGCKPSQTVMSPLEQGDHPELDDTELLDAEGIQHYQSLIGSLPWEDCRGMKMREFRDMR